MSSNFSSLRANRKTALAKITEEIAKESQKGGGADARFWKLPVDQKTKVGYAVIRFLPAPKNEESYWVRIFNHAFKMNGAWLIENCPTTLGRTCPVCKENNKLWNSGLEADKDVARDRKRKLQFISNILIVNDQAHPENNGKVFLFKYGKKIYEKLQELIDPQFPDKVPSNPFDLWEGSDFKLKAQMKEGYQNYDKSEFSSAAPVFGGDDAQLETLWESEHSLQQFIGEDQFKNYEDLEKRFIKVLTGTDAPATAADAIKNENPTPQSAVKAADQVANDKPKRGRKPAPVSPEPVNDEPGDGLTPPETEEDMESFFERVLA